MDVPFPLVKQRVNRQAGTLVFLGRHVGIEHATNPVLWTVERSQRDFRRLEQQVDRRAAVARQPGVIGDQADTLAAKQPETVANQDIDAGQDSVRRGGAAHPFFTGVRRGGSRTIAQNLRAYPSGRTSVQNTRDCSRRHRSDATAERRHVAGAIRMQSAGEEYDVGVRGGIDPDARTGEPGVAE